MPKENFGIDSLSYGLILDTLSRYRDKLDVVILFGSRANGNYKHGSDIDLALKTKDTRPDATVQSEIYSILNEEVNIPYAVDILDYYAITNPRLKDHIDRVGISITFF